MRRRHSDGRGFGAFRSFPPIGNMSRGRASLEPVRVIADDNGRGDDQQQPNESFFNPHVLMVVNT